MKNWEKISLRKEDTILRVLEVLNEVGSQFVVITDTNKKLLGTVTDGDIRRGLLRGVLIQDAVERVMNFKPCFLLVDTSKKIIQKTMKDSGIKYLPLVSDQNEVVDIVSLSELIKVERKENHVILMAGGLGTRLEGLTVDCPKPMLKVGGKPILETIINSFVEHGFYKFILAVNYKADVIKDYFKDGSHLDIEITYLNEKTRMGTAGALSLYEKNDLPFIVMNGDLLTKINFSELINFHNKNKNAATMCLRQYEHQIPFGVVVTEDDKVLRIEEKPTRRYFVNGGIYVVEPTLLKHIPQDMYYDMPNFFENLIEKKEKVGAYPFNEYWIDIGRLDDFERAHADFLEIFK